MAVPGPMVTHANGAVVPSDTPSVATAKAKFHHAGGNIEPAKASFHPAGGNINSMAGVAPVSSKKVYSGPMAVPGPLVTHSNGAVVPKDTPSVATARANFHQAGGKIKPAKAAFHHTGGHVNSMVGMVPAPPKKVYSGPMAVPGPMVTHPNGAVVPEDTPAIATTKANFHQAGGNIKPAKAIFHHAGGNVNPMVGMVPAHSKKVYSGPMAVPGPIVTHENGAVVPADTPSVASAKAKFHHAGGNIKP